MGVEKMTPTIYDPKEVDVIVAGITMTGFGDGDKVVIEPVTKEEFKSHAGVDGDVSFSKVNDDRHTCLIRLKQSSPSNAILDGLRMSPSFFPVSVQNKRGGAYKGGSVKCLVLEKPSAKFGAEEQVKEWKIICASWSGAHLPESE